MAVKKPAAKKEPLAEVAEEMIEVMAEQGQNPEIETPPVPPPSMMTGHSVRAMLECPACGATATAILPAMTNHMFDVSESTQLMADGFLKAHMHPEVGQS